MIRLTAGHQAKIEDKPEVRKGGGVYYTPAYIVEYIVQNTVGKLLDEIVHDRNSRGNEAQTSDGSDRSLLRPGATAKKDVRAASALTVVTEWVSSGRISKSGQMRKTTRYGAVDDFATECASSRTSARTAAPVSRAKT